jgi:polyphosphate glucokinase
MAGEAIVPTISAVVMTLPSTVTGDAKTTVRGATARGRAHSARPAAPSRILVIDIGGSRVKLLVSGTSEPRKFPSGKDLTPAKMVAAAKALTKDWRYDAVSIGFPGLAGKTGPTSEPGNLGKGWVGYDFAAAFDCPVKIANDAAMQALGSYEGGRMLFLGLGTGVGGAFIADHIVIPVELGELPWRRDSETLGKALSSRGLERAGKRAWRQAVEAAAAQLMRAFRADYLVIGGGNAKKLKRLPHGLRLGHNQNAFRGGFRMWAVEDLPALSSEMNGEPRPPLEWRLL